MKLIHCADLHLDSKLHTHLDRDFAKRRRDELLQNFERLAGYASQKGVEAVLIAGDLFDRDSVSALAKNTVLSVMETHPEIRFYYLRGNHDKGDCLGMKDSGRATAPSNLFLFGNHWKTYREGKNGRIAITGMELTPENSSGAPSSLRADPAYFNIVMLHGQETGGRPAFSADGLSSEAAYGRPFGQSFPAKDAKNERRDGYAGVISIPALRGRNIDYLALGHIHAYKKAPLDSRGIYCYPGCLEGRGFDECGPRGFVMLEIDEERRTMTHRFVPFAQRTLYAVRADVTGCMTTAQMKDAAEHALRAAGCTQKDMADVTLCGELEVDCEKDLGYLGTVLESEFFFARLRDATRLHVNVEDYLYDESLRGEFVRMVMADPSIRPQDKTEVIRCGFRAMDGEELV